jgi:hypothetical protein
VRDDSCDDPTFGKAFDVDEVLSTKEGKFDLCSSA